MKEIKDGIYVETGYQGANVGFIATDGGAVLVDTPMLPADAWRWLRRVARIVTGGLAYLVNTDYHGSHILGNCFFPAVIIAHELTWREVKTHGEALLQQYIDEYKEKEPQVATELAEVKIVAPEVTITDNLMLHKGGRAIEVIYLGGHTPASIGVHVADSKALFTGDVVVTGRHPSLAEAQTEQWLQALERIRGMDVEVIVPGHGEPCDLAATESLSAYISEMRQRVETLYRAGASRREAVEKVRMAMIDHFPVRAENREAAAARLRASIERIYEEIRKGQ